MAYAKARETWLDDELGGTPILAENLEHIEAGIETAAAAADAANAALADKASATHTHPEIGTLTTSVAGKADSGHTHAEFTSLDNRLDTAEASLVSLDSRLDTAELTLGTKATTDYVDGKVVTLASAGMVTIGTPASPVTNPSTARPAPAGVVYWFCAADVTPSNAVNGDLIWNA